MKPMILHYRWLALILIFFLNMGCERFQGTKEGQIVLSSQFDLETATLTGYHFESSSFLEFSYAETEGEIPDIVLEPYRLLDGSIKPGFSSPSNNYGFALAGSYENRETSEDFFNNVLKEVDTTLSFTASSDTVRLYQIWILKTSSGNYAKLHVLDIELVDNEFGRYNNVTLDYVHQPDGSPNFP